MVSEITYKGAQLSQDSLALANMLVSDEEGLVFDPTGDDMEVTAEASITGQPTESNTILWDAVDIDLLTQFVGDPANLYTNILTVNQANCGADGNTNGFTAHNGAVISSSNAWAPQGSRSIKVVTDSSQTDQGVQTTSNAIIPGVDWTEQVRVKGVGSFYIILIELDSSNTYISQTSITGTISAQEAEKTFTVTRTMGSTAAYAQLAVRAVGTVTTTFYIDEAMINQGSVAYDWIRGQTSAPTTDFELVLNLLGITCNGDINLVGEQVLTPTSISSTETAKRISYDLLKSACEPHFYQDTITITPPGKIRVNLPMRALNYESFSLVRNWLSGWPKRKAFPLMGDTVTLPSYAVGPITIPYVSGMNTNFSDIRFTGLDGQTILDYWLESYTAGSTSTFYIRTPSLTSKLTRNVYVCYGNTSAINVGDGNKVFPFFDDFKDNAIDTTKWTSVLTSGVTIAETNQEIQITGNGTGRSYLRTAKWYTSPFTFEFIGKRSSTGSVECVVGFSGSAGSSSIHYAPYNGYHIWFDGTTAAIDEYINGVSTNRASVSFSYNTNYQKVTVYNKSDGVSVYVNGSWVMSYYPNTTFKVGYCALTNGYSASGVSAYYNNVRVYQYGAPSTGSLGSEESTITVLPDTYGPEQTYIDFTVPSDWSAKSYARLVSCKNGGFDGATRSIPLSTGGQASLGFDGLDQYIALRVNPVITANNDYAVSIPQIKFSYEA